MFERIRHRFGYACAGALTLLGACQTDLSSLFVVRAQGGAGGTGTATGAGSPSGPSGVGGSAGGATCEAGDLPAVESPPPLCATCDGCSLCAPSSFDPTRDDCTHACDRCQCMCPAFSCLNPDVGHRCEVRCSEATTCAAECEWNSCTFMCDGCSSAVWTTEHLGGITNAICKNAGLCDISCNSNNCGLTAEATTDARFTTGSFAGTPVIDCVASSTCTIDTADGLELTVEGSEATVSCSSGPRQRACDVTTCAGGSTCEMTCSGAERCDMTCDDSSSCTLRCGDTPTSVCTLSCTGATVSCADGVQVCEGMSCPPSN